MAQPGPLAQALSQAAIKMSSRPRVIDAPEKDLFKLTQWEVHSLGYRTEGLSSSLAIGWRLPLSLCPFQLHQSKHLRQKREREAARELHPLPDLRSGVQNACLHAVHQEMWPRPATLWRGMTEALNGAGQGEGTHMKMLPTQLCASPGLGTGLHMNTEGNTRSVERSNHNDNNNSTIVPFVSQCKVHKVLS